MARASIATTMSRHVAVRRTAEGLAEAAEDLSEHRAGQHDAGRAGWEATNVATVATALLAAATLREESRGCHWREDHPDTLASYEHRIVSTLDSNGNISLRTAGLEDNP
jgi:L-aspartate oxidase